MVLKRPWSFRSGLNLDLVPVGKGPLKKELLETVPSLTVWRSDLGGRGHAHGEGGCCEDTHTHTLTWRRLNVWMPKVDRKAGEEEPHRDLLGGGFRRPHNFNLEKSLVGQVSADQPRAEEPWCFPSFIGRLVQGKSLL